MLQEATHTLILTTLECFVHDAGILSCLHVVAILHNSELHDLQGHDDIFSQNKHNDGLFADVAVFGAHKSPHAASSLEHLLHPGQAIGWRGQVQGQLSISLAFAAAYCIPALLE
jgi:hypothetical protein